jgi:gamma-glutamyl-gamma-aminobutyrate hydrolase PuuD
MKYLVGITASKSKIQNFINDAYIKAFTTEKTTPIIIPNLFETGNEIITKQNKKDLQTNIIKLADTLDALVLSGGADLNPVFYNNQIEDSSSFNFHRDYMETELIKEFIKRKKPILGICRGFQLLGLSFKLNYFQQDISISKEKHNGISSDISNRTEPMHSVFVFGEFKLYCEKMGMEEPKMLTNSWHEQGFTLTPDGARIKNKEIENFVAEREEFKDKEKNVINSFPEVNIIMSTNYVIEGFEHKTYPILAFQNHPEEYSNSIAINYFIEKYIINLYEERNKKTY